MRHGQRIKEPMTLDEGWTNKENWTVEDESVFLSTVPHHFYMLSTGRRLPPPHPASETPCETSCPNFSAPCSEQILLPSSQLRAQQIACRPLLIGPSKLLQLNQTKALRNSKLQLSLWSKTNSNPFKHHFIQKTCSNRIVLELQKWTASIKQRMWRPHAAFNQQTVSAIRKTHRRKVRAATKWDESHGLL
jgi:hypothetical protein